MKSIFFLQTRGPNIRDLLYLECNTPFLLTLMFMLSDREAPPSLLALLLMHCILLHAYLHVESMTFGALPTVDKTSPNSQRNTHFSIMMSEFARVSFGRLCSFYNGSWND